jgi:hypothetical protein
MLMDSNGWLDSIYRRSLKRCAEVTVKLLELKFMVWYLYDLHCKKRLANFQSPAGMSLTKLSVAGNNYSRPGRVRLVTSRLGTGKSLTFFYSVQ